jgi:hypothetical protein
MFVDQVPVGGAIVISPSHSVVDAVSRIYPGRAALAPILDLFITLLQLGKRGLIAALTQRKAVASLLRDRIASLAASYGERLLESRGNPISFAMSIDSITGRLGRSTWSSASSSTGISASLLVTSARGSTGRQQPCVSLDQLSPIASDASSAGIAGLSVGTVNSCSVPLRLTVSAATGGATGTILGGSESVQFHGPRDAVVLISMSEMSTASASDVSCETTTTAASAQAVPLAVPVSATATGSDMPRTGPLLNPTYLGSMLFSRGISGTRVVSPGEVNVFLFTCQAGPALPPVCEPPAS